MLTKKHHLPVAQVNFLGAILHSIYLFILQFTKKMQFCWATKNELRLVHHDNKKIIEHSTLPNRKPENSAL